MADIRPASGFAWSRSVLLDEFWKFAQQFRARELQEHHPCSRNANAPPLANRRWLNLAKTCYSDCSA